ncbi:unnamed protein product [Ambrosiozyma monospora]|uniref:Unnamed protein product n=1 Tax=Ambrosiozyma monospora TaxID=43982 RepID=A0ACB5U3S6_AMBMO|nr:unnamed protein product [Ambrosiozyma monospora]
MDQFDLHVIARYIRFPQVILKTKDYCVFTNLEAWTILIARFASKALNKDLANDFNLPNSGISKLIKRLTQYLFLKFFRKIEFDQTLINADMISKYSTAIQTKGTEKSGETFDTLGVFAFIDGTHQSICKPGNHSDNGFYGAHGYCYKYQGVTAPNGFLIHVSPAAGGNLHDSTILRQTQFLNRLDAHLPVTGTYHRITVIKVILTCTQGSSHHSKSTMFHLWKRHFKWLNQVDLL